MVCMNHRSPESMVSSCDTLFCLGVASHLRSTSDQKPAITGLPLAREMGRGSKVYPSMLLSELSNKRTCPLLPTCKWNKLASNASSHCTKMENLQNKPHNFFHSCRHVHRSELLGVCSNHHNHSDEMLMKSGCHNPPDQTPMKSELQAQPLLPERRLH